jgi:hypothetical protein
LDPKWARKQQSYVEIKCNLIHPIKPEITSDKTRSNIHAAEETISDQ